MKSVEAACVTAVALLLAAAAAVAASPALTLHLTVPLSAARLEHLQELDRAWLARRDGVPELGLLRLPG